MVVCYQRCWSLQVSVLGVILFYYFQRIAGKTEQVEPTVVVSNVVYGHTDTHWMDAKCMIKYAEKILLPDVKATREKLELPAEQVALILLDTWAAHFDEEFVKLLAKNYVKVVPILPGM
jgi:hypothetical protein